MPTILSRRLIRLMPRTLLVAALVAVMASPALAAPPAPGWQGGWMPVDQNIHIMNAFDHKCLDEDVNSLQLNGTRVQMWDCNGLPQQTWRVVLSSPIGGHYELRSVAWKHHLECLDADTNGYTRDRHNNWNWNNATRVQLWRCQPGDQGGSLHQQEWPETPFLKLLEPASEDFTMELTTPIADSDGRKMCLDTDTNTGRQNGGRVQLWRCLVGGGPYHEQAWYWEPASNR